jgi:hypothetical protein
MANATAELMWIQTLLHELGISSSPSAKLWCDEGLLLELVMFCYGFPGPWVPASRAKVSS